MWVHSFMEGMGWGFGVSCLGFLLGDKFHMYGEDIQPGAAGCCTTSGKLI